MFRPVSLVVLLSGLAACSATTSDKNLSSLGAALAPTPCEGTENPNCVFINGPVALRPEPVKLSGMKQSFFPTDETLEFVDAQSERWVAPPETLTDGATIPNIFVSVIGDRQSPEFANAAAMHDAYCGIGNEKGARYHTKPWQTVHRMFYAGLRVGGTPAVKAKIMFSAVYLGGPRWRTVNRPETFAFQPPSRFAGRTTTPPRSLGNVPTNEMVNQLNRAIDFIRTTNPTLSELEVFLISGEDRALAGSAVADQDGDNGPGPVSGVSSPSVGLF